MTTPINCPQSQKNETHLLFIPSQTPKESQDITLIVEDVLKPTNEVATNIDKYSFTDLTAASATFFSTVLTPVIRKNTSLGYLKESVTSDYVKTLINIIFGSLQKTTEKDLSSVLTSLFDLIHSGEIKDISKKIADLEANITENYNPANKNTKQTVCDAIRVASIENNQKDELIGWKNLLQEKITPLKNEIKKLIGINKASDLKSISIIPLFSRYLAGEFFKNIDSYLDEAIILIIETLARSMPKTKANLKNDISRINKSLSPTIQILASKVSAFAIKTLLPHYTSHQELKKYISQLFKLLREQKLGNAFADKLSYKENGLINLSKIKPVEYKATLETATTDWLSSIEKFILASPEKLESLLPKQFLENELKEQIEYTIMTLIENLNKSPLNLNIILSDLKKASEEPTQPPTKAIKEISDKLMELCFPDQQKSIPFYNEAAREFFFNKIRLYLSESLIPMIISKSRTNSTLETVETSSNPTTIKLCASISDDIIHKIEPYVGDDSKLNEFIMGSEGNTEAEKSLRTFIKKYMKGILPDNTLDSASEAVGAILTTFLNLPENNLNHAKDFIWQKLKNPLQFRINSSLQILLQNFTTQSHLNDYYIINIIDNLAKISQLNYETVKNTEIKKFVDNLLADILPAGATSLSTIEEGFRSLIYEQIKEHLIELIQTHTDDLFQIQYTGPSVDELYQDLGESSKLITELTTDGLLNYISSNQTQLLSQIFNVNIIDAIQISDDIHKHFLPIKSEKEILNRLKPILRHLILIVFKNIKSSMETNYSEFRRLLNDFLTGKGENSSEAIVKLLLSDEKLPIPPLFEKILRETLIPQIIKYTQPYMPDLQSIESSNQQHLESLKTSIESLPALKNDAPNHPINVRQKDYNEKLYSTLSDTAKTAGPFIMLMLKHNFADLAVEIVPKGTSEEDMLTLQKFSTKAMEYLYPKIYPCISIGSKRIENKLLEITTKLINKLKVVLEKNPDILQEISIEIVKIFSKRVNGPLNLEIGNNKLSEYSDKLKGLLLPNAEEPQKMEDRLENYLINTSIEPLIKILLEKLVTPDMINTILLNTLDTYLAPADPDMPKNDTPINVEIQDYHAEIGDAIFKVGAAAISNRPITGIPWKYIVKSLKSIKSFKISFAKDIEKDLRNQLSLLSTEELLDNTLVSCNEYMKKEIGIMQNKNSEELEVHNKTTNEENKRTLLGKIHDIVADKNILSLSKYWDKKITSWVEAKTTSKIVRALPKIVSGTLKVLDFLFVTTFTATTFIMLKSANILGYIFSAPYYFGNKWSTASNKFVRIIGNILKRMTPYYWFDRLSKSGINKESTKYVLGEALKRFSIYHLADLMKRADISKRKITKDLEENILETINNPKENIELLSGIIDCAVKKLEE